jgi:hypothetical protein
MRLVDVVELGVALEQQQSEQISAEMVLDGTQLDGRSLFF